MASSFIVLVVEGNSSQITTICIQLVIIFCELSISITLLYSEYDHNEFKSFYSVFFRRRRGGGQESSPLNYKQYEDDDKSQFFNYNSTNTTTTTTTNTHTSSN